MLEEKGTRGLLPALCSLAEAAGEAIMSVYRGQDLGTTYKPDHSPLTQADLAAHHLILDGLSRLTPDWPALSEESREIPFENRSEWGTYWLIDPLDGTKEFIKGNDEFTVNIALIADGLPVMGVVSAPALGLSYFAEKGRGAFKKTDGNEAVPIAVKGFRGGRVKIVSSRSHGSEALARFLERIGPYEALGVGSSLKLCMVAEGAADLYPRFGRTMEWDTAAAHCVVSEAGGSVTTQEGRSLRYNKPSLENPEFFVRGNPPFPLTSLF